VKLLTVAELIAIRNSGYVETFSYITELCDAVAADSISYLVARARARDRSHIDVSVCVCVCVYDGLCLARCALN